MPVVSTLRTLSTTRTLVASGGTGNSVVHALVANPSATIYVGGADVTTANGLRIQVDESVSIPLGVGDDLYVVASAGTPTVTVLTTRT